MGLTSLLMFLLIGLIDGWLAGIVMRGHGFGLVGDIVVGIIGAFIGGFLFSLLGLGAYSFLGSILVAFVGALVLILILRTVVRSGV